MTAVNHVAAAQMARSWLSDNWKALRLLDVDNLVFDECLLSLAQLLKQKTQIPPDVFDRLQSAMWHHNTDFGASLVRPQDLHFILDSVSRKER